VTATATPVTVVRTGTANLASVFAGLERVGGEARLATDPDEIRTAPFVVLPGVGAFAAAMAELEQRGLVAPLAERIRDGRATLCVCLGLQLLCESSAEAPGVRGLGVLPVHVGRFTGEIRVPQMGWNATTADSGARFLRDGHAYFANSFRLEHPPPGWRASRADHGGSFVAALERRGVLACQFHPELSGAFGTGLLRRWLHQEVVPC